MPASPPTTWHPILQSKEYRPGHWVLFDSLDQAYALVTIIRKGDEVGYRAETADPDPVQRNLLGYYRTLFAAATAAYQLWIARPTPKGNPATLGLDRVARPDAWTRSPGKANTPARTERD